MCNEKLKALGLEFTWKTRSTTSFVGIGSKTNTLGTRQMPFGLLAETNEIVKGHCESYELDKGSTPMLLPLYAQCTLGMIKDLEKGTCSVKHDGTRRSIPLFKCRKTGFCSSTCPKDCTHCMNMPIRTNQFLHRISGCEFLGRHSILSQLWPVLVPVERGMDPPICWL